MPLPDGKRSGVVLHGRDQELAELRELVERCRAGRGAALVLLADAGLGASALVAATRALATGFRTRGVAGIAAEAELPGAAIDRLLGEPAPDHLAVGHELRRALTVGDEPTLCWVDGAHALDRRSLEELGRLARRLTGPLLMLFTCAPGGDAEPTLAGLPTLVLRPLDDTAARRVLRDRAPDELPPDLAGELVALASGVPRALIDLVDSLTPGQLCGTEPPPEALPPDSTYRAAVRRALNSLPPASRVLVQLVAEDLRSDLDTVLRAATELGVDGASWRAVAAARMVVVDGRTARPPNQLMRSTLRAESAPADRRRAHELLGEVLDPDLHRLRWAWHRATVTGAPQDADLLDGAAARARLDGDHHGAFLAYRLASELSPQREVRALRLVSAGADAWLDGRPGQARFLLRRARPLSDSAGLRAVTDLMQGGLELHNGVPSRARATLLNAAEQLCAENNGPLTAMALMLAGEASCLAGDFPEFSAIARRAEALRRADDPPPTRLLLDHVIAMAATYAGRHERAVPLLREVVDLAESVPDAMPTICAAQAAYTLGDFERARELAARAATGSPGSRTPLLVPWASIYGTLAALSQDSHHAAENGSLEALRIATAAGQHNHAVDHLTVLALLAALQGDRGTAELRLNAASEAVTSRGLGRPGALSSWASACVDLVCGRPADALDRFRFMAPGSSRVNPAIRALAAPHLVEAAVRCGEQGRAVRTLRGFDRWAHATASPSRLALSHRCHALLDGPDGAADEHFREAIRLHRVSETALELAKTELFYGTWLRRGRKPSAAREHLHDAVKIFRHYRADTWTERARAELRATGESVAEESAAKSLDELTPQQAHISRLVAEGATNREIADRLFLSPRTIDHHLRNIFTKLGLRSRVELSRLLR